MAGRSFLEALRDAQVQQRVKAEVDDRARQLETKRAVLQEAISGEEGSALLKAMWAPLKREQADVRCFRFYVEVQKFQGVAGDVAQKEFWAMVWPRWRDAYKIAKSQGDEAVQDLHRDAAMGFLQSALEAFDAVAAQDAPAELAGPFQRGPVPFADSDEDFLPSLDNDPEEEMPLAAPRQIKIVLLVPTERMPPEVLQSTMPDEDFIRSIGLSPTSFAAFKDSIAARPLPNITMAIPDTKLFVDIFTKTQEKYHELANAKAEYNLWVSKTEKIAHKRIESIRVMEFHACQFRQFYGQLRDYEETCVQHTAHMIGVETDSLSVEDLTGLPRFVVAQCRLAVGPLAVRMQAAV